MYIVHCQSAPLYIQRTLNFLRCSFSPHQRITTVTPNHYYMMINATQHKQWQHTCCNFFSLTFSLQSYASKGNDNYQLCATFSFDQYAMHLYSLHLYFAWKLSQVGVLIYFQIPIRRWQITCCVFLCTLELWSYKKPMNVHNTNSLTLWTTVRRVLMILDDGI